MKKIQIKIKAEELKKKLNIKDGRDGIDGKDGIDGQPADEAKIVEQVLTKVPPHPDAEAHRDALETLEGDERLDKKAIKGLEELEQKIDAKRIQLRGGAKGFQLYVDGSKKGLTVNTLNLIAGTGMTLTYNSAFGRNDVTFTAGSGALALITVTGTIDDSNTSFTAASTPQIVVINGAGYRTGKGVTVVGTAITTDNPVGTGGDIYCLG